MKTERYNCEVCGKEISKAQAWMTLRFKRGYKCWGCQEKKTRTLKPRA